MVESSVKRRRALSRALTRIHEADVEAALAASEELVNSANLAGKQAWRIGITGAPGSGKSTLIGRLAKRRLEMLEAPEQDAPPEALGILSIDPSSPLTQGSILGDRVRMEHLSSDSRVFLRSLPSRSGRDGLTHNIIDVMNLLDSYGFQEILLETVGIGQAEHAVRLLADCVVLVLHPESGDSVQAMKAGVMEMADIYVVNKADLPGARKTVAELRATLRSGTVQARLPGWEAPVIEISRNSEDGIEALHQAIEEHRQLSGHHDNEEETTRTRQAYHVQSLVQRRIEELAPELQPDTGSRGLRTAYHQVVRLLASDTNWN